MELKGKIKIFDVLETVEHTGIAIQLFGMHEVEEPTSKTITFVKEFIELSSPGTIKKTKVI